MSRYRPPQPPSSKYITAEGYRRLQEELEYLWKVKRPQVTAAVAEARNPARVMPIWMVARNRLGSRARRATARPPAACSAWPRDDLRLAANRR